VTTARPRARRAGRTLAAGVAAGLVAVGVAACTVTFGDPDDPAPGTSSGTSTSTGTGAAAGTGTTIEDIEEGEPMRWDVSRPITAESVGLGDSMAVVKVPGGAAQVELTMPDGVWTTTAEELTIAPRRGYVNAINVFRTFSGGQAVHDQLVADAEVLGFPRSQIDGWLDELPASLEPSRSGGLRERTGINGSNGDVVTSVEISHDPGPGGDESIRLWYAIGPVTPE
jgi:hypothetical protein